MTQRKNKPCGWMCVEKHTGARDGIYREKAVAEYQCGWKQVVWSGSTWDLVPAFRGDSITEYWHRSEPMYSRLVSRYGKPDYEAADEYDRAHGRI